MTKYNVTFHQIFSVMIMGDWLRHVIRLIYLACHREFPIDSLFKSVHFAKNIWQIINAIHVASICHENIIRYLSLDIIFPLKLTVSLGLCSQNTVHFSQQIMSVEISKHIFTPYNLSKIAHTEFADLVDTLRTQLKPTAAKIKWHYKVDTYHFYKFYFNNAVHKNITYISM